MGARVIFRAPGIFRTGLAASALRFTKAGDGRLSRYAGSAVLSAGPDGRQPNDPAKAAPAIIAVVESETPPLRLPLGADAAGVMRQIRAGVGADVDAWGAVVGTRRSMRVAAPGAGPAARDFAQPSDPKQNPFPGWFNL